MARRGRCAEGDGIDGLFLASPCGVTASRQMAFAGTIALRASGVDGRTVRRIDALRRALGDAYRLGDQRSMREQVDRIRDEPWFGDALLPDPADPGDDVWADLLRVEPTAAIARLRVPVTITYGDLDRWIPVTESLEAWRHAYRGPRLTLVRLPGTGHRPVRADGHERLAAEYERALLGFVARLS